MTMAPFWWETGGGCQRTWRVLLLKKTALMSWGGDEGTARSGIDFQSILLEF